MRSHHLGVVVLVAILSAFATSCQSQRASSQGAAAASAPTVAEARPKQDIRELRTRLPGTSMKHVVALIGSPSQVFTIDEQEIWEYGEIAYDPITRKSPKRLELVFVNRKVEEVNFSY